MVHEFWQFVISFERGSAQRNVMSCILKIVSILFLPYFLDICCWPIRLYPLNLHLFILIYSVLSFFIFPRIGICFSSSVESKIASSKSCPLWSISVNKCHWLQYTGMIVFRISITEVEAKSQAYSLDNTKIKRFHLLVKQKEFVRTNYWCVLNSQGLERACRKFQAICDSGNEPLELYSILDKPIFQHKRMSMLNYHTNFHEHHICILHCHYFC